MRGSPFRVPRLLAIGLSTLWHAVTNLSAAQASALTLGAMPARTARRCRARRLLAFYVEAGVDAALDETATDRFAAKAARDERTARATERAATAASAGAVPRRLPDAPARRPRRRRFARRRRHGGARGRTRRQRASMSCARSWRGFEGCALTHHRQAARASPTAIRGARVMFVGEAPGREEDIEGLPFVGRSGKLLDRMLAAIGLDRTQVYIANIMPWRPPGNRTPTPQESRDLPAVHRCARSSSPIPTCWCAWAAPSAQALLGVKDGILKTRGRWFAYPHRRARDPRDRDPAPGLSAAPAAAEAARLA